MAETAEINLSGAKTVTINSKNDLIDLLRSGEVVVIDTRTGRFLDKLMGVPLPNADKVLETVIAKGGE